MINRMRAFSAIAVFFLFVVVGAPHLYAIIAWDRLLRVPGSVHRRRTASWQAWWTAASFPLVCLILGLKIHWALPTRSVTSGRPLLVISNHQSSLDILILKMMLYKMGYADCRWVLKRQVFGVPVLGRSCKESGCAGIERSGQSVDLRRIERCAVLAGRDGASVILFPEGTRFSEARRAQGYANVLPPKSGGFAALRRSLPGFPVLSVTLRWDNGENRKTVFDAAAFVGRSVRVEASVHADLPTDSVAWLSDEWRRKDSSFSA